MSKTEASVPSKEPADASSPRAPASPAVPKPRRYKREPKPTPLPMSQVVPMTFVLLNESLTGTMLTPFVAYLVAHMEGTSVDSAGYTAGLIVGAFSLGQVISAKMWGWLSDVYGRRFPLIMGLFLSGLMLLGFGLSNSIWMCVLFRLLHGIFNGNTLVAKTMMADITNKSNEAKGFAFVSLCFGLGSLIGPTIGGYLYNPPEAWILQWAHFDPEGFHSTYPAFLPCFIMFLYTLVGMFACTFFVLESNPKAKPLPGVLKMILPCFLRDPGFFARPPVDEGEFYTEDDDDEHDEHDDNTDDDVGAAPQPAGQTQAAAKEVSSADPVSEDARQFDEGTLPVDSADSNVVAVPIGASDAQDGTTIVVETPNAEAAPQKFGYKQAFSIPVTRFVLTMYMLVASADAAFGQIVPLWMSSSQAAGGLGFLPQQSSLILLCDSFPCILSNLVFPSVCKRYANKMGLFRVAVGMTGIAALMVPMTSYFLPDCVSEATTRCGVTVLVVVLVLICTCGRQFFVMWGYAIITMLTARAAPAGHVGAIMGINQSSGAVMRALVPIIAAPIYAWSIGGHHVFPFDHVFVFFLSSLTFLCAWVRSYNAHTDENNKVVMEDDRGVASTVRRICHREAQA